MNLAKIFYAAYPYSINIRHRPDKPNVCTITVYDEVRKMQRDISMNILEKLSTDYQGSFIEYMVKDMKHQLLDMEKEFNKEVD